MLTYFRVNDPYRMLGILGLALLTRLPFLLSGDHLTVPELGWMLVGERLSEGHRLYVGVWDNIGPLTALLYQCIEFLSDRKQLIYAIMATLLITHQALVFNSFLLNKKAYGESTYVPAMVYVLLSSFSFDFYTLSPVLLSLTWVMLAMRNLFYRIEGHSRENRILSTGLYVGIAALFYLPSVLYLASIAISYILFASVSPRHFMLLLYGFAMPFLLAFTYFFIFDALQPFIRQFLLSFQYLEDNHFISLLSAALISMVPLGFLIASFYLITQNRFTNQQSKLQQIMLLKLLVALLIIIFVRERAPYHLLLLVPPAAFFVAYLLLLIKRFLIAELVTAAFAILLVLNGYAILFGFFSLDQVANTSALLSHPTAYEEVVAGKKTLLLGDNLNIYRNSQLATPYLNWQLSSEQLKEINYFENLTQVYVNFSEDMPEVIVDEEKLMPQLSERIPAIRNGYRKLPDQPVYIRK